jgi:hypothetical protein
LIDPNMVGFAEPAGIEAQRKLSPGAQNVYGWR